MKSTLTKIAVDRAFAEVEADTLKEIQKLYMEIREDLAKLRCAYETRLSKAEDEAAFWDDYDNMFNKDE